MTEEKWYTLLDNSLETPLKRTFTGLIKLTRFNEFGYFGVITTLLGIAAARGNMSWRLLVVLMANWLAVSFAYMLNDIEDAPDDAFSVKNYQRNPVSVGLISPKTAKIAMLLTGLISVGLFALLGFWPLIFGITCLILGIMYSVKTIRLKTMTIIDIISRGLLLGGLPFLCSYFAFASTFNRIWFWPFLFVMSSTAFWEHHDEGRGAQDGRPSRLRQALLGLSERSASVVMIAMITLVTSSGVISFFLIDLVPAWVVLTITALLALIFVPLHLKTRRSESPQVMGGYIISAVERAVAIGLMLQFLLPWLDRLLDLGWF